MENGGNGLNVATNVEMVNRCREEDVLLDVRREPGEHVLVRAPTVTNCGNQKNTWLYGHIYPRHVI